MKSWCKERSRCAEIYKHSILMQSTTALNSIENIQEKIITSPGEDNFSSGGEVCDFPKEARVTSPFFQPASAERLNLSETANDLSPCPEEVTSSYFRRPWPEPHS